MPASPSIPNRDRFATGNPGVTASWRPLLAATALAVAANRLLSGEWFTRFLAAPAVGWSWRETIGCLCLVLAVVAAVRAFRPSASDKPGQHRAPPAPPDAPLRRLWWPAALYLAANVAFVLVDEGLVVHLLWIGAVIALVAPHLRRLDTSDFWPIPFWEYCLIALIGLGAFTIRYVDLTELPLHVDNDVAIMGLFSKRLLADANHTWIGMAPTNHQYSEHQFLTLSMRLFGADHYGLVMLSVLAGTATTVLIYALGKLLCNRWVGLLAAAFLASDYVHLHFSRIIFGPFSTFFLVLACLFLVHGLRRGTALSFALSGVAFGLGLLAYYSARVGPVIGFATFSLWWWRRADYPQVKPHYWLYALAGMVVAFGPNLLYLLANYSAFHGRGHEVVLWTPHAWSHLSSKYAAGDNGWIVIGQQILRTVLAPFHYPDESTIFHLRAPMLGALAASSLLLGIGYCLARRRLVGFCLPLLWIGLTFLFGGILTIDPPFWPHLNIATPALALVAAIGFEALASRLYQKTPSRIAWLVPVAVVATLGLSAVHNWEIYHRFASRHAGGRILSMRQIQAIGPGFRVYLVSPEIRWEHETYQFFTPRTQGSSLPEGQLLQKIPEIDRPTAFFLFEGSDARCVDVLVAAFPGAIRQVFRDGWGYEVFTLVKVAPPGHVDRPQERMRPFESMWTRPGWRYVSALMILLLIPGWFAWRAESNVARAARPR